MRWDRQLLNLLCRRQPRKNAIRETSADSHQHMLCAETTHSQIELASAVHDDSRVVVDVELQRHCSTSRGELGNKSEQSSGTGEGQNIHTMCLFGRCRETSRCQWTPRERNSAEMQDLFVNVSDTCARRRECCWQDQGNVLRCEKLHNIIMDCQLARNLTKQDRRYHMGKSTDMVRSRDRMTR